MEEFILDASVAVSWCMEDETEPYADQVLIHLNWSAQAIVPSLWPLEVANTLAQGVRRQRLTSERADEFLETLAILRIRVVPVGISQLPTIRRLATAQRLTVYDAAYLHLAIVRGLPLASLDQPLCDAAKRCGVPLLAVKS